MNALRIKTMALLGAAFACLAIPRAAEACGGTFCDSGPRFMSVDQTGENIIFVMEPGMVQAHIQILYKGDAAHFSWVLPVQALPDVQVGSQALFDRLLQATVPRYGYTTQRDACNTGFGVGTGTGGAGGGFAGGVADAAAADGGVNIVLQKTVGAFEVIVLSGGTTDEVLTWLTANQYQTPPNAAALFDVYVAKHYLFVAVKLTGGAGIDQIHPLVVRYPGTQPCVPLMLTAVAAVEDMGVRTFFLGTKRVVPKNFKHVVPNPVWLDWMALGTNYNSLVGDAVDSPIANGKAFVTEYAGPTAVVGANRIAQAQWDAVSFAGIAAVDVVTRLQQQGFLFCNPFSHSCSYNHPLILPLLREFLPPPTTLTLASEAGAGSTITDPVAIEGYFYSCTSCYQDQFDATKWNADAFRSALSSRIIEPARHADALVASWPYLTRMFTTISPAEMTADPEFWEHDGLANVSVPRSAVRRITCSGASGMTLPDGRQVALTPQSTWPGWGADMPFAERIEEFTATGDPLLLVDNTETINVVLKKWNDSQQWPPPATGGAGATGAGGATGTAGASTTGGFDTTTGPGAGGSAAAEGSNMSSGCGCRTIPASSTSRMSVALGALAGLLVARRRRSGVRPDFRRPTVQ